MKAVVVNFHVISALTQIKERHIACCHLEEGEMNENETKVPFWGQMPKQRQHWLCQPKVRARGQAWGFSEWKKSLDSPGLSWSQMSIKESNSHLTMHIIRKRCNGSNAKSQKSSCKGTQIATSIMSCRSSLQPVWSILLGGAPGAVRPSGETQMPLRLEIDEFALQIDAGHCSYPSHEGCTIFNSSTRKNANLTLTHIRQIWGPERPPK